MKQHTLRLMLLAFVLCLAAATACGEGMITADFFSDTAYHHVVCDMPEDTLAFDAVFYPDGSFHGVTDALAETCGYYAILPDGMLILDVNASQFQLKADERGGYTGASADLRSACSLTPIARSVFDDAVEKADMYIDAELDRVDIPLWDYPVYARVTMTNGLDLLVNPAWPEVSAGHLPAGTVVLICGQRYDENAPTDVDTYLLEANGIRGFALSMGLEALPARRAKVVRSSSKDRGRTVNIRSTPDYGDNVIMEVPYGEIVDVFQVVEGEFTRVFYDYGVGWMTTVRLQIINGD